MPHGSGEGRTEETHADPQGFDLLDAHIQALHAGIYGAGHHFPKEMDTLAKQRAHILKQSPDILDELKSAYTDKGNSFLPGAVAGEVLDKDSLTTGERAAKLWSVEKVRLRPHEQRLAAAANHQKEESLQGILIQFRENYLGDSHMLEELFDHFDDLGATEDQLDALSEIIHTASSNVSPELALLARDDVGEYEKAQIRPIVERKMQRAVDQATPILREVLDLPPAVARGASIA